MNAKKINIIDFANARILTVQSGKAREAALAIKTIQSKAKGVKIEDYKTIKNVFEESIREVRKSLLEGWNFTEDRAKTYLQLEADCQFLVAFYFSGEPYLLHIDNYFCTLCPTDNEDYAAIGIGNDLAKYLLKEYKQVDPNFEYADLIATDVIEKVKANVKDCDGPTWIGIVEHVHDSKAAGDFGGYKAGDIIPAEKKCEAFICRRQLTDSIALHLKNQELKAFPKKKKEMRNSLCLLCKKIGGLVYTDYDSPDGDGAFRFSAYAKSDKTLHQMFEKSSKQRHQKPANKKSPPQ